VHGGWLESSQRGAARRLFLRRARPELSGFVGEDWDCKVAYDVGDVQGWRQVRVRYRGWDAGNVTVGNQFAPFGLEQSSASNHLRFLERSLANALTPGFHNGVKFDTADDQGDWAWSIGAFGPPLDGADKNGLRRFSVATRATWAIQRTGSTLRQIGVSFERKDVDQTPYRVRSRPETRIATRTLVNTRPIADVSSSTSLGLEYAWVEGVWSVQAECMVQTLQRRGRDLAFWGGYIEGSWFLTGERRRYGASTGTLGSVRPDGEGGAVEVAARFSYLDLAEDDVRGGRAGQLTLGINWHLARNLRIATNYSYGFGTPDRRGRTDDLHILTVGLVTWF